MRILCLPYTYTLSHISRPLAVAKELSLRGHEVVFAGNSLNDRFIKNEGFEVLPIFQLHSQTLFGRIREGKLNFVLDDELKLMVDDDCRLIDQVKPDLLLTDGRFSAAISAGIKNINHVALVNVSSTEYRALPYVPFFDWLPPNDMLNSFNLKMEMFVFDNSCRGFIKLCRQHELEYKVTATNCLAGKDLTLLADIPEYFPTRSLPSSYKYIGPLTWKSSISEPLWWPPRKQSSTLVYFTMGTTWLGGSFSALYDSIQSNKFTAIVSTGGQAPQDLCGNLENIPGKIYIEDFIDGDLVMEACDLVVCHGGNGTIYQALQQGKPIIGIPSIPDQKFNMRRVESLGVGKQLSIKEFEQSPEKLFELIQEVLNDDSYTEAARNIQKILCEFDPAKTAADLIETM